MVRWSKQHRAEMRCIVLVRGPVELEQARPAGADAVFLRSSSAREMAAVLRPEDPVQ